MNASILKAKTAESMITKTTVSKTFLMCSVLQRHLNLISKSSGPLKLLKNSAWITIKSMAAMTETLIP